MGAFWSLLEPPERENRSLLALLNENTVDWEAVCNRLRHEPEEAAAFCHSIDPSPLTRSLLLQNPPVSLAAIQALLDSYEDAVHYCDRNGTTPLQAAIQGTTTLRPEFLQENQRHAIVQLLLRANSQALQQKDIHGRLPVHFARTLSDVTEILVRAYPEGARHVDAQGRLPLHSCVEHAMGRSPSEDGDDNETPTLAATNLKVVKILVETGLNLNLPQGGVLSKDKHGTTPLDLICQEIQACVEQQESPEQQHHLDQLWEILCLFVQTTCSPEDPQVPPPQPFRLVHALVSLFCPASVVSQALLRHPEQARERDHLGRTPLMIAAASIEKTEPKVICELLKCNKDAARMTDADGRLPIDLAAENGVYNEELWEALVMAEPRAVDTRDLRDKNFPFMTAAIGNKSNVNTVYRLLRTKPHVVNYFNLS